MRRTPTIPSNLRWVLAAACAAVFAQGLTRQPEPFVPGVAVALPAMPWWLLLLLAITLATATAFVFRRREGPSRRRDDDAG